MTQHNFRSTTRDGRPVKIYEIYEDSKTEWPVHGAYQDSGGRWHINEWMRCGRGSECEPELDLMPAARSLWFNEYPDGYFLGGYDTKEAADGFAGVGRIACHRFILPAPEATP